MGTPNSYIDEDGVTIYDDPRLNGCGGVFCDACGDCSVCYGGDPCYATDPPGEHIFIYPEMKDADNAD
ncbi:MAG TPA: hypothetical protein VF077_11950 [Nitrospiraceae bacterium]